MSWSRSLLEQVARHLGRFNSSRALELLKLSTGNPHAQFREKQEEAIRFCGGRAGPTSGRAEDWLGKESRIFHCDEDVVRYTIAVCK